MKINNINSVLKIGTIVVLSAAVLILSACTFLNKATFSIDSPSKSEKLLNTIENYFKELGLPLERKIDFSYPENRKERSYFLGRTRGPIPLHTTYSYVVLRVEESGVLYLDWIKISDTKQVPKPEYFEQAHTKIENDLKTRFGVDVKFKFIEPK